MDLTALKWYWGEARLTENVILQCYSARPSPQGKAQWRLLLMYQRKRGEDRIRVHMRYAASPDLKQARTSCYVLMRRWLRHDPPKPPELTEDEWQEIKSAFRQNHRPPDAPAVKVRTGKDGRMTVVLPDGTLIDAEPDDTDGVQ